MAKSSSNNDPCSRAIQIIEALPVSQCITGPDDNVDILNGVSLSYNEFIKQMKGFGASPDSYKEECCFYLLWICRFLACTSSKLVINYYLSIARCLANGVPVNMSSFLLGELYRAMFLLSTEPKQSHGAPIWLIQMWAYSYFPSIAPELHPTIEPWSYGEAWMHARSGKISPDLVRSHLIWNHPVTASSSPSKTLKERLHHCSFVMMKEREKAESEEGRKIGLKWFCPRKPKLRLSYPRWLHSWLLETSGSILGCSKRSGSILGCSNRGGSILGCSNQGYYILGGSILGGSILSYSNRGGSILGGSILGGSNLGGSTLRLLESSYSTRGGSTLGDSILGCSTLGGSNRGDSTLGGSKWGGSTLVGSTLGDSVMICSTRGCSTLGGWSFLRAYHWVDKIPYGYFNICCYHFYLRLLDLSSSTMLLASGDISVFSYELELPSGNLTPFPEFFILLILTGIYDSHCGRQLALGPGHLLCLRVTI
uniref:Aminotransferase-like plant mobile domain-containing protein n=1 Tax=Fagus sylvatica TaxID=28930 RepID=A0A2N9G3E2_FAGSY